MIDVTELEVGNSIRIGDIQLNNLEVIGAPAIPVVSCNLSRAMKGAADAAATATTAATPAAKVEAPKKQKQNNYSIVNILEAKVQICTFAF